MDAQHHHSHHESMVSDFKKRFWISLALTIPIVLLSPMIQEMFGFSNKFTFNGSLYVLFLLSTLVFFYGGWPFLTGFISEIKKGQPGMMTLIALAIIVAYLYSTAVVFGIPGSIFYWELATLIDIMLLGHWVEMRSVMGAGKALESLARLMPQDAHHVLADGTTVDVPLSQLKVGDKVLVKPGEKIPADGKVIDGESSVDEALLTGESRPITKKKDATVIGGSINGEGSLVIIVSKFGSDSFLAQVIKLVKEAEQSKSRTQNIANKAAQLLTIIAISAGIITLFAWLWFTSEPLAFAIERMVTVMVITCPHALGLAVPLVVAVSTAIAARQGLLIRNRTAFEQARKVNAMVFDKTGTLTQGKFGITDVVSLDHNYNKDQILALAGSIEAHSEHPIAKTIANAAPTKQSIEQFKAIPGKGAEGMIGGKKIAVVSKNYLRSKTISADELPLASNLKDKTLAFVLLDDKPIGIIALGDIVRAESKMAVKSLQSMGIKCIMLTGDNKEVASAVAKEVGVDEFIAEVLPQDKVNKIKEIQAKGYIVGMTGDGVNDAPALSQADVGIAIGGGTDVAIESADIILVKNNPLDVVAVIKLAQLTTRKMIQNLFWATGYNIFAIPLAAGVLFRYGILLSPALGAVLMSLSTIVVAINARLGLRTNL